jgi:GxxExxY protein
MHDRVRLDSITEQIIGAAIAVHRELGPGLLESAYEDCLAFELAQRGLAFTQQTKLPLVYKGRAVGDGYRVDLWVEGCVIVEVKCAERLEPVHTAQVLSYLRLSGSPIGLLLNFNVKWLSDQGLKRIVHGFPDR